VKRAPRRGDIVFASPAGAVGAEVRKERPWLVVSPDDRYLFVTCEGVGSEPGAVDIIDLATRTRVASVDVGQMAGGIDVWRVLPVPAAR